MAKRQQPETVPTLRDKRSVSYAKALRLPCMDAPEAKKLADVLTQCGATMEVWKIRANDVDGGRTPFALKVKVSGFTFVISQD